jgi:Uma2 family endonuclease
MTVLAAPRPLSDKKRADSTIFSLEQYLLREEKNAYKSEFYNGKIFRMPGGKFKHNLIAGNIFAALKIAVKELEQRFWAINSDQKIYIPNKEVVVYPDAVVISEKPIYWNNRKDLITNPLLVVEVLSKSTRGYDKGEKFVHYRTLPSFKEYVLIEQDECKVEIWYRTEENTWTISTVTEEDALIYFNSIGVSIPISDIYENVDKL